MQGGNGDSTIVVGLLQEDETMEKAVMSWWNDGPATYAFIHLCTASVSQACASREDSAPKSNARRLKNHSHVTLERWNHADYVTREGRLHGPLRLAQVIRSHVGVDGVVSRHWSTTLGSPCRTV